MAKCKWCSKGGLFQKVDKAGLCGACAPVVVAEIEKHCEAIYEAMHVFERATDRAEKLRECDRVIHAAQALLPYDGKGLETSSPPPGLLVDEYRGFREQCASGS